MKIHIVRPADGWILQRIGDAWARDIRSATASNRPDQNADINVWVNYALFKTVGNLRKTNCDVGYFTHRETTLPLKAVFDECADLMDWCISMCAHTSNVLPSHKTTVIHNAPHASFYSSQIIIGIACRDYPRKQLHLVQEIREISDRIKVEVTGGSVPFNELPKFYESLDYLLVLSDNEGGPLPVVEAIAMGVPVIAPDVGWCWEYPCIKYESWDDLKRILRQLALPKDMHKTEASMVYSACLEALA